MFSVSCMIDSGRLCTKQEKSEFLLLDKRKRQEANELPVFHYESYYTFRSFARFQRVFCLFELLQGLQVSIYDVFQARIFVNLFR